MTNFPPEVLEKIERIRKATKIPGPSRLNQEKVEKALMLHMDALKQPRRPVVWHPNLTAGIEHMARKVEPAARDAARAAAWAAARAAAWAAAWDIVSCSP